MHFPDGRELRFVELRARHEWDWKNKYIVDMELMEIQRGHPYAVKITINWEEQYATERQPSETALFDLARRIAWEYFAAHKEPPCLSRHPFPIQLEF